jgi:hypothetical protein
LTLNNKKSARSHRSAKTRILHGHQFGSYFLALPPQIQQDKTKLIPLREVAAGSTMVITDLVPKSGDDTAPARSNEEKFLSPTPKVNQLVIVTPRAL